MFMKLPVDLLAGKWLFFNSVFQQTESLYVHTCKVAPGSLSLKGYANFALRCRCHMKPLLFLPARVLCYCLVSLRMHSRCIRGGVLEIPMLKLGSMCYPCAISVEQRYGVVRISSVCMASFLNSLRQTHGSTGHEL